MPAAKPEIAKAAARFLEDPAACAAPGDFAQALFDLGATICTPKNPACAVCPWFGACRAAALGIAPALPARAPKALRPSRVGTVYVLLDGAQNVLLLRRPPSGLLGGMLVLPETPPLQLAWRDAGAIQHVFTHFALTLTVRLAIVETLPAGLHAPAATAPLPSVMRKALDAGLAAINLC